jgi:N-acetylglucosaminyl-diphospho-decaprenol L-rhamnosyltransferase
MTTIDVAICIVTYKSADLTIDCLRSIELERSTPSLSIRAIVVDNASGDAQSIQEAIERNVWSSWVTLIEAPRNGGFAYGNNLAFQRAYDQGPPSYFHVLNPDTRVFKGAVAALVWFLETHPDVGIAGSRLEDVNGKEWAFAFRFPSILGEVNWGLGLGLATRLLQPWVVAAKGGLEPEQIDWVSGTSMMIRRAVIDSIGGLDENYFLYFEDPDFCLRARRAGFATWYVPESRIMHVSGQSSKVTGHQAVPKRLPSYWFESRRRYFTANYGLRYARATDAVALLAHGFGSVKRLIQGRVGQGTPHLWTDLARHSPLWPKNCKVAPVKSFVPRH